MSQKQKRRMSHKEESVLTLLNATERPNKMISPHTKVTDIHSERSFDGVKGAENSGVC